MRDGFMADIELKPCPFCGGEAKMKHGYPGQQRAGIRQAVVQCKAADAGQLRIDSYHINLGKR